jgi:hypothetical protein
VGQKGHGLAESRWAVRIERVGHQACKHHRATYGQWSPRPPQVQGTDMPVPDGFVVYTFGGDFLDGEGFFY